MAADWKKKIQKRHKHLISLISGILILLLVLWFTDFQKLSQLPKLKPLPIAGAFLSSILITACIALRWGSLVNSLAGEKITNWFRFYYYFIVSRALGFILPKDVSDFGFRMALLKKGHNYGLAYGGISVALDRLFDVLFLGISVSSVILYWFELINGGTAIFIFGILVLSLFLVLTFIHNRVFHSIEKIINTTLTYLRKLPFLHKRMPATIHTPEFEKKLVLKLCFISLIKLLATISRFVFFALSFGLNIPILIIILGTPLAQASYLIAFTPGGLGILEAGWLGVLKWGGVNDAAAGVFILGQRILTVLLISLLAFITHSIFSIKLSREK